MSTSAGGLRAQQEASERQERELMDLKMEAAHLRERLRLRVGGDATAAELEAEAFTLKRALSEAQEALVVRERDLYTLDDKYRKAMRNLLKLDEAWKQAAQQAQQAETRADEASRQSQVAQQEMHALKEDVQAAMQREQTLMTRVDVLEEDKQRLETQLETQAHKTQQAQTQTQELRAQLEATKQRHEAQLRARAGATREDVKKLEAALQTSVEDAAALRGEASARKEEGAALEAELLESRRTEATTRERVVKLTEELAMLRVHLASTKQTASDATKSSMALDAEVQQLKEVLREREKATRTLENELAQQQQMLQTTQERFRRDLEQELQTKDENWRAREAELQQEVSAVVKRREQSEERLAQEQQQQAELADLLRSTASEHAQRQEVVVGTPKKEQANDLRTLVEQEIQERRDVVIALGLAQRKLAEAERQLATTRQLQCENASLRAEYDKAKVAMERMATRRAKSSTVSSTRMVGPRSISSSGHFSSEERVKKTPVKTVASPVKRKLEHGTTEENNTQTATPPRKAQRTKHVFVASRYLNSASKR